MKGKCFLNNVFGLLLIFSFWGFAGCATSRVESESYEIYGIVGDSNSNPIASCVVRQDGSFIGITNEQGMFVLHDMDCSGIAFECEKSGYETKQVFMENPLKNGVLYLKLFSVDELLEQAEMYLRNGEAEKALVTVFRCGEINDGNVKVRVMKCVCYFYCERYEECLEELNFLRKESDSTNYELLEDYVLKKLETEKFR